MPPAAIASPTPSTPPSTPPPTLAPSPTPIASAAPEIIVDARSVSIPPDPHYVMSWSRLLLLDPAVRTATEVASILVRRTTSDPGYPLESVSASRDGRVVLLTVRASPTSASIILVRPEAGQAQTLVHGLAVREAVLSPDGGQFAVGALNGLWVGKTADGSLRRLITDDPQWAGAPPVPFTFSPDGTQLAFGLGVGDRERRAGLVPVSTRELTVDRTREPATITGATLLGVASSAEFVSDREMFVWSSASPVGGTTLAYSYDLAAMRMVELYRPSADVRIEAAWRPGAAAFATIERRCCGVNLPGTAWLRFRDGSTRKLGEMGGFVGAMWWSRDGSRLYALVGGDDSTGGVIDVLTGQGVMAFCTRGGGPPPAPCT